MATNLVQYVIDIVTGTAKKNVDGLEDRVEALNKDLEKTEKEAKDAQNSLERMKKAGAVLSKVGMAVTAVAIAIAGVATVSFKAAQKVTDLTNELNDLSVRSGLSAKTIQALRQSLTASGQNAEGLNEILGAMSNQFAQLANEGSAVEKKFNSFGIAVKDANGNLRTNNDILLDGIKKIQSIGDSSEKSRTAVLLFGEAGAKLNQALAAGNFEKFIEFTERFGISTGPRASLAAAEFQKTLSALNLVLNATLQKLVNATDAQNKFINGMIKTASTLVYISSLLETFEEKLVALTNGLIFLAKKFILVLVKGVIPFASSITFVSGIIDDLTKRIPILANAIDELTDKTIDYAVENNALSAGLLKAKNEALEFEKSLQELGLTTIATSKANQKQIPKEVKEITKEIKAIKEKTEAIRTLNDVLNDITTKLGIKIIDSKAIERDLNIVFNALNNQLANLLDDKKITNWIDKLKNELGTTIMDLDEISIKEGANAQMLVTDESRFKQFLRRVKIGVGELGIQLDKVFSNISANFISGLAKGISTTVTILTAVFSLAERIGSKGGTQKEIKKNIEEDIRARAKAISLGLQVLPSILFDVFPKLFRELSDSIGKAIGNLLQNLIDRLGEFLKSPLEKIGDKFRENNRQLVEQGVGASIKEFLSRYPTFRSGGKYIPSARGGIKFTGAEEGLAMLHRGEFVVPETGQMPQAVQRTMGMGNGGITININASVVESNAVDELVRQIERRFQTFGSSTSPLFGGT